MKHQLEWDEAGRTKNAPDVEAIKLLQFYEGAALHADPRGYCVCTSEKGQPRAWTSDATGRSEAFLSAQHHGNRPA